MVAAGSVRNPAGVWCVQGFLRACVGMGGGGGDCKVEVNRAHMKTYLQTLGACGGCMDRGLEGRSARVPAVHGPWGRLGDN